MKKLTVFLTFLGLVVVTAAMAWSGFDSVLRAVMRIGLGGFLLMVCCQLAVDGVLGMAWHAAFPEIGYVRLLLARMVRDAAATCLPFSQVGGLSLVFVPRARAMACTVHPTAKWSCPKRPAPTL